MVRLDLLSQKISDCGLKMNFVADKLGMTPQGLSKKFKEHSEWTAYQIAVMIRLLHLTKEEVDQIFFALDVDEQSTEGGVNAIS